jgi:hypothetical protein
VLDGLHGFDWDAHNVGHIAAHAVMPQDVEQTVRGRHIIIPAASRSGEKRWKLFGRSADGRYLVVVVFTIRNSQFRTVTAYTMNQSERRVYAPQIEG